MQWHLEDQKQIPYLTDYIVEMNEKLHSKKLISMKNSGCILISRKEIVVEHRIIEYSLLIALPSFHRFE